MQAKLKTNQFKENSHQATGNSASIASERSTWRNAFVLLRIPFSMYLMPVFWFALSNSEEVDMVSAMLVFVVLHVFMIPASYGFNSIYDRDEKSIGGLESPPPAGSELFQLVLVFDALALLFGAFISIQFAAMVMTYTVVSKAYSFDKTRLKRFPLISTWVVAAFQGAFLYYMVLVALKQNIDNLQFIYGLVAMLLIAAMFPLMQIYQHDQDEARGDVTLSLWLGIRGTFIYSAIMMVIGFTSLFSLYLRYKEVLDSVVLAVCILPMLFFFAKWMVMSFVDEEHVHYKNAMKVNGLWAVGLSLAFIFQLLYTHYLH
jgi:4-hydroxybenzoate polyprenyltransferase